MIPLKGRVFVELIMLTSFGATNGAEIHGASFYQVLFGGFSSV